MLNKKRLILVIIFTFALVAISVLIALTSKDKADSVEVPDKKPEVAEIIWENKVLDLGEQNLRLEEKRKFGLFMDVPTGWIINQSVFEEESSYTLNNVPMVTKHNCNLIEISDPERLILLTIKQICKGWGASYSPYDPNSTIVSVTERNSHSGPSKDYRIRYSADNKSYKYFGALINKNEDLESLPDTRKDVLDTITIGFPPPNESLFDYHFLVANAELKLNGSSDSNTELVEVADKIIGSLYLRPNMNESVDITGKNVVEVNFPNGEDWTYVALELGEGWQKVNGLSKVIDDVNYRIGFQVNNSDYLRGNYGGDAELVKSLTTPSGKELHVLKTRHYIELSSCVPEFGYGCSPELVGKYLFVMMNEYRVGDQYVRELDFTNPATDQAILEFTEMMKTLSF